MRNIKFADEMFVLNPRHVLGICDLLIERGYDLNIWAYARVDTVKDGMLDKLKRAGFNWLALGIEAADERVLTDVDKRYRVERGVTTRCGAVKDAGINIIGNYIFGLPEDDARHDAADARPGARAELRVRELLLGDGVPRLAALRAGAGRSAGALPATWSGYSQHAVDTLPLPTRHLSAGEVLRFRDRAFDTYFSHQPYLAMVRAKFGDATFEHIREMTAHRIERLYATP